MHDALDDSELLIDPDTHVWDKYGIGGNENWLSGEVPNAKWAQARWDELWSTGKRGHYETLARIVFEAYVRGNDIGRESGVNSLPVGFHECLVFKDGTKFHVCFDSKQDRDLFNIMLHSLSKVQVA